MRCLRGLRWFPGTCAAHLQGSWHRQPTDSSNCELSRGAESKCEDGVLAGTKTHLARRKETCDGNDVNANRGTSGRYFFPCYRPGPVSLGAVIYLLRWSFWQNRDNGNGLPRRQGDMQNHATRNNARRNNASSHIRDLEFVFSKTNRHKLIMNMHLFQLNLIVCFEADAPFVLRP